MGTLAAYTLYSGIFLLAGYLIYKWMMAAEKQYAINRSVLLGIYALSFAAWPLTHLSSRGAASAEVTVDFGKLSVVSVEELAAPLWPKIALAVYLAGCAAVLVWTVIVAVRLCTIIAGGERRRCDGYCLVLLSGGRVAPFSWGRYIVMTEADYDAAGDLIIAHERAHLRLGHCYDLIMAQLVCILLWYNPASWLMREELKTVHEFQADGAVIASGADVREYQMLLIKKAAGTRFQSLANSLNHSKLKQRITMMYKEKSKGLRRLRGLVLGVAPVMALAIVNIPAVASAINGLGAASLETPAVSAAAVTDDKDTEKTVYQEKNVTVKVVSAGTMKKLEAEEQSDVNTKAVSNMRIASFPGGENEMFRYLSENVQYPQEAMEKNIEGRSVIGFTVEADGTLSNFRVVKSAGAMLDREATRVIASMPKWNPALNDGVAVSSQYVLPVSFKLSGTEKAVSEKTEELPVVDAQVIEELKVVGYTKPVANIGQDKSNQIIIHHGASDTSGGGQPVVMVDGELIQYDKLNTIDVNTIESISVMKDIPEYPDGLIIITLKK